MEATEKVDERYKLGFEHGYWLTRGKSAEYDGILKRNSNNQFYSKGMVAGKTEAIREQTRDRLQNHNRQSRDTERGMDRD